MQLHCLRVARLTEQGRLTPAIASLAKLHNTRRARHVIAEARDVLGGEGILVDRHVIRHLADVESLHTYEGTDAMLTLIVGRELTGQSAFA
jgi:glutaryl-CoA dehydrogenase